MANRYLVRTRAGDHIASDEAMILEWLKQGHCGAGDFVFVESNATWIPVCDLPEIAAMFAAKPGVKLEKPVITVFKLGHGKSLQHGPFTLSAVLEMLVRGELCASSWIFIDGDKEWRQVRNVKVLRDALPPAPEGPPRFELTDVSRGAVPAAAPHELDLSMEALQNGITLGGATTPSLASATIPSVAFATKDSISVAATLPAAVATAGAARSYATARAAAPVPEALVAAEASATSVFEVTRQSQPSIVPLPEGLGVDLPPPVSSSTKTSTKTAAAAASDTRTATLTKTSAQQAMDAALADAVAAPPRFVATTAGFTPTPGSGAAPMPAPPQFTAGHEGGAREEVSVRLDTGGKNAKAAPPPMPVPGRAHAAPPVAPAAPAPGQEPSQVRFEYRQANAVEEIPDEEQTKAVSKLGLAQKLTPEPDFQQHKRTSSGFVPAPSLGGEAPVPPGRPAAPVPPPARAGNTKPKVPFPPGATAPTMVPPLAPAGAIDDSGDEGIVVEIPQGPIWLIKQERSERVTGPYSFQQVIDLLRTGQITKEDKISKQGTNRFAKIAQQYEFNVKYSVETVVEDGVERQKILIKRRHPRAAYMTDVHVMKVGRKWLGKCVNVSAGGILLESGDLEAALGDTVMIEIMPGAISRKISVSALVIGRIPKKPPGFALRFVDLKTEDKEAIEYFVMESLKKEKAMGM